MHAESLILFGRVRFQYSFNVVLSFSCRDVEIWCVLHVIVQSSYFVTVRLTGPNYNRRPPSGVCISGFCGGVLNHCLSDNPAM